MKKILIFGGTGQCGTHLVRKLTKNNYRVTVVTRNIHEKGHKMRLMGNAGYINLVEASIFDEEKLRKLFEESDICINFVGILFEKKRGSTFKNIHSLFPALLAKLCKEYKLDKFIHLSALGIEDAKESNYALSKLEGEKNILNNFPKSTILRPSLVYSNSSDNFSTNFMTLLSRLPIFPLYYGGKSRFMPIHASDLTDVIYHVILKNVETKIIECVGPETITFKQILNTLLDLIDKKRLLIPFPIFLGNLSANFFELFPKPLLTKDQLKLLKYDNISSGKYKTNSDIGVPALKLFAEEVKKYSYMWKEGGQYTTEKYNSD